METFYLTRGAVFSYYEFLEEQKRLTDEDWQLMIKEGNIPSKWIGLRNQGESEEFEIPEPTEPYSSGC